MNQARRRISAPSMCAVLLMGLLAGCGGSSSTNSSSSASASGDHRGGTLKVVWNGIGSSIDTAVDYDQNWQLLTMTNDGLLTWKKVEGPAGNTLVPDLATSVPTPTDGGLIYTFTLRKGIKYSTGETV